MRDTEEYTDLEIIEQIDEAPVEPCIWWAPPCSEVATWDILWSCGCVYGYCDEHVGEAHKIPAVGCSKHGPRIGIHIVAEMPR